MPLTVIPVKTGIQVFRWSDPWTPVFTGVTTRMSNERLADQAFAWRERSSFPDEVSYKLTAIYKILKIKHLLLNPQPTIRNQLIHIFLLTLVPGDFKKDYLEKGLGRL